VASLLAATLCQENHDRIIGDALSLNNYKFGDFVDRIYPIESEIKDTTDTAMSASYLDLHLEIDSECLLRTKLHDKRNYCTHTKLTNNILAEKLLRHKWKVCLHIF
jgi:hypothetical protein